MNISLIALGSQGDVQPYIALGVGLKRAGHHVRVITHENYGASVEGQQLEFSAVQGNVQEFIDSPKMRELLERGNFLAITAHTAKESQRAALLWAAQGLEACRDAQLIVAGVGGLFVGLAIAEKLNLPILQAHVFPFTPTSAFAGALFPQSLSRLGGAVNRLSHEALRQAMWQGFRAADTLARTKVLGLPANPFWGPYQSKRLNQHPTLYGFSPSVIAPPADWSNALVTGYWLLEPPSDWQPPAALEAFLSSGEAPIYIGFGSMASRNPAQTAELILKALKKTRVRAILQTGWGGLQADSLPDQVLSIASVPHSWLFNKVAGVVHHGGAGTTAAGLQAGVPSLVIPFFGDQGFWGERVAQAGVGPSPIPRKVLTAERLAQGIQTMISNAEMRTRAAELGKRIRAEDGVGNAVKIINQLEYPYTAKR